MHLGKTHKASMNSRSSNPEKGVRVVNWVLPRGLLVSSLVLHSGRYRFPVLYQRVFTDEMTPSASR